MAGAFEISSSEARRLIGQGGVKLDGEPIPSDTLDLAPGALDGQGPAGRQAPLPSSAGTRLRAARQTAAAALYSFVLLGKARCLAHA